MIKILFNGLVLDRRKTGYTTVIREFLLEANKRKIFKDELSLLLVIQKDGWKGLGLKKDDLENIKIINTPNLFFSTIRGFFEQLIIPFYAIFYKVDLIHKPSNFGLLWPSKPVLQYFHTSTSFMCPQYLHGRSVFQSLIHNFLICHTSQKSKFITTTTDTTATELFSFFGFSKNYHTVGNGTTNLRHKLNYSLEDRVERKEFILSVSSFLRLKNQKIIIKSFQELLRQEFFDHNTSLVLIGNKLDTEYFEECFDIARDCPNIFLLTDISNEQLANYYNKAKLYIFISKFEGFGLTPLEALTFDIPIVLSNIPVLKEVYGDGFNYADPDDIHDICRAIKKSLTNEYHQYCTNNPLIKKYTWSKFVDKHIEIYRDLLEN